MGHRRYVHRELRSTFYLSKSPQVDTIVFFVHGFDLAEPPAVREVYWGDVLAKIRSWAECDTCDFGFYFYPKNQELPEIVDGFRRVISAYSKPVNPGADRRKLIRLAPGNRYRRMVFVGHSLGALIARLAILDVLKSGPLPEGTLVLFAPAHCGLSTSAEQAQRIVKRQLLRSGFWRTLVGTGEVVFPCLQQVPRMVGRLHGQMKLGNTHPLTRAQHVFHVKGDPIVVNAHFFADAPAIEKTGTSHWAIHRTILRKQWPLKTVMEACR